MRGLKRLRSVQVISAGHVFVENLRRDRVQPGLCEAERPVLGTVGVAEPIA